MNYLPNEDGARWFLGEIFPLVLRGARPRASPSSAAPARLPVRPRASGARSRSPAASTTCARTAADIFVVPLRIGGGTRLKILEALAMRLPLVSTRVDARPRPARWPGICCSPAGADFRRRNPRARNRPRTRRTPRRQRHARARTLRLESHHPPAARRPRARTPKPSRSRSRFERGVPIG
ncbi:MAG: glycosyltransferase [Planctomycetes bacterium]|nr:glycosyltransferase [Planctomycetota bacterium]